MTRRRRMLRIGEVQASSLDIYVFDVAHNYRGSMQLHEDERGTFYLSYYPEDTDEVFWALVEAANSADVDVDHSRGDEKRWARANRDALTALSNRVLATEPVLS